MLSFQQNFTFLAPVHPVNFPDTQLLYFVKLVMLPCTAGHGWQGTVMPHVLTTAWSFLGGALPVQLPPVQRPGYAKERKARA